MKRNLEEGLNKILDIVIVTLIFVPIFLIMLKDAIYSNFIFGFYYSCIPFSIWIASLIYIIYNKKGLKNDTKTI